MRSSRPRDGRGHSGTVKFYFASILFGLLSIAVALADPVGEMHRVASEKVASLRDAQHRDQLRITIWYPAASDAIEQPLVLGPPDLPLRDVGAVAANAAPAANSERLPVILLSHGFGGTARLMGWFGISMARNGYVVIAVDHPGNNGIDEMTIPGAILYWDRADDLRTAFEAIKNDPIMGPHLDGARVGVAGFSAGGFTALVAGGARVTLAHLARFCAASPNDGVCRPQRELAVTPEQIAAVYERPEIAAELAHAGEDHSVPGVRAVFGMAPALVQALDPMSLANLRIPVHIILGDADEVAPPATNGLVAAKLIPGAELQQLADVGHYDFAATCTDAGRKAIPTCNVKVPQPDTHNWTIAAALVFFDRNIKRPR